MTERGLQEVAVPVDQFEIARSDLVLAASLRSSFALCLYDEVNETGALLHMQIGRPGQLIDPELTDNTLSTNLLLLDRCIAELRHSEPRARHWQAKFVAHANERSGGRGSASRVSSKPIWMMWASAWCPPQRTPTSRCNCASAPRWRNCAASPRLARSPATRSACPGSDPAGPPGAIPARDSLPAASGRNISHGDFE